MQGGEAIPQIAATPATHRLAIQGRVLRAFSAICQIVLVAALFIMWKVYQVPFAKAFERCFVAGVLIYVVLGSVASILMTLARIQPVQLLLRRVMGIISIVIFGALHYVDHLGIMQSAIAWAAIYAAARLLVARIGSRALQRFQALR